MITRNIEYCCNCRRVTPIMYSENGKVYCTECVIVETKKGYAEMKEAYLRHLEREGNT